MAARLNGGIPKSGVAGFLCSGGGNRPIFAVPLPSRPDQTNHHVDSAEYLHIMLSRMSGQCPTDILITLLLRHLIKSTQT